MVKKLTFAHQCTKVYNIMNIVSSYTFWPLVGPSAGRCITMDGYIEIVKQFVNQFIDAKY
jgi:hypothetical protein